ncbi:MAG: hypothetical protein ACOYOP_00510 [Microthrixaceae bacterium]
MSAPSPAGSLRAAELVAAVGVAAEVLADHAAALDELHHGDAAGEPAEGAPPGPGSDLAATLAGAAAAAAGLSDFSSVSGALVRGAEGAAVGRAGRSLTRFLGGGAEVLRNADVLDAGRVALVLEAGAEALAAGDDGRHPGGMAAVAAAAADGALAAADAGAALADVLIDAADAGLGELERGAEVDEVLADRGVVDASAAGFLLLLDVLASVVTGEPLPAPPMDRPIETAGTAHRYEVRCSVVPHRSGDVEGAAELEATWYELGELVEFRRDAEPWRVAVITPLPGAAVEAVLGIGRPVDLRIALHET